MAAVLPFSVGVGVECLLAGWALEGVHSLPVNFVQMGIPPLIPAFVAAETRYLSARDNIDHTTTVLTFFDTDDRLFLPTTSEVALEAVPSAVGFDCVFIDSNFLGDLLVAEALESHLPDPGPDLFVHVSFLPFL